MNNHLNVYRIDVRNLTTAEACKNKEYLDRIAFTVATEFRDSGGVDIYYLTCEFNFTGENLPIQCPVTDITGYEK